MSSQSSTGKDFKRKAGLSIQKFASDQTGLGYGLSSSNTTFTSTTVFVPLANNVKTENNEIKLVRT